MTDRETLRAAVEALAESLSTLIVAPQAETPDRQHAEDALDAAAECLAWSTALRQAFERHRDRFAAARDAKQAKVGSVVEEAGYQTAVEALFESGDLVARYWLSCADPTPADRPQEPGALPENPDASTLWAVWPTVRVEVARITPIDATRLRAVRADALAEVRSLPAAPSDGPAGPGVWRWRGVAVEGMQPKAWACAVALWDAGERGLTADELFFAVEPDERDSDRDAPKNWAKKANTFFAGKAAARPPIGLKVRQEGGRFFLARPPENPERHLSGT